MRGGGAGPGALPGQRFLRADYGRRTGHPHTELNREETPGDVDCYTLRGTENPLFWRCLRSPELAGATNVAVEAGESQPALEYVFRWVADEHPYNLQRQVAAPG